MDETWNAATKYVGGEIDPFVKYSRDKWKDRIPNSDLLRVFGYFELLDLRPNNTRIYLLSPKAFALLNRPATPAKVFISYKRDESSALGLLIESRLKLVDSSIGVFIDKLLEPGDKWHERLEEKVRQSRYFVCLLAPKSLGSKYVRNEIEWALDESEKSGTIIIPICHNGYSLGSELHKDLRQDAGEINALIKKLSVNNAIPINPESAEEYELAMIKLLSKLGYSNIS